MKSTNSKILASGFILIFIISFLFPAVSPAQFGKNKVQYKDFKWNYIQSKHFDVYFYQDGYDLAEFTATVAESSLVSLSKNFDYNISNRIPLVSFQSHNDFQQNNILDEYMPEGVGGVTELFKNRVLVPFEGNFSQYRHVIHHELTHAFMNDMFYGGSIQNIIAKNITLVFPGWFAEGMSEVQSLGGLDKETDMYIRDAVLNDYLPPLEYLNGYFSYRGGQSFFSFLQDEYGKYKIGDLMNNIRSSNDINEGFKQTYKLDLEKLNEKWHKYEYKMYWADAKNREEVSDFAKRLTDHTKDGGFYNIAPKISPKGDKFAFISDRSDNFDVYLAKTDNGDIEDKLISGNTSNNFEELQILTPGLSWSPDGNSIAISVKAGESDAIFLIDVNSGDKTKLPIELNSISSVAWSPDKDYVSFIGTNGKESDLYMYNIKTGKLESLTHDVFSDANPVWSPDGKSIIFNSDRGDYLKASDVPADFKMTKYNFDNRGLYEINIKTKEISKIVSEKGVNISYVQFSRDGKRLLYVSDENGIHNVYSYEPDSSGTFISRPITNSLNPITQISLSKDDKKLLFVSMNKGGYDIYSIDNPFERNIGMKSLPLTDFVKKRNMTIAYRDSLGNINRDTTFSDTLKSELPMPNPKADKDSTSIYGNDITINFGDTEKDKKQAIRSYMDSTYASNQNFKIKDYQNPDGTYKINKYKIKFSPDLVYGNANYSSYYGVQGVASIALSDLMGDHRIYILTSMVVDLKNSDYALAYYYLPKRIDYGFAIYHTARFLYYDFGAGDELFRYTTLGGSLNISYPLSKFKRIDASLGLMKVNEDNLDDSSYPSDSKTFLVPTLSYVFDNSTFGYISPIKGARFNITLMASPKLGDNGMEFESALGDFRKYFKLFPDFTFAARFATGLSFGSTPQRFYIGGVENWINRDFTHNNIPISNINEYAFSMAGLPLRGYDYDALSGSKYAITNLEFRFPVFKYLIFGFLPLGFENIQGNLFFDAGTAWTDKDALKFFKKDNGSTLSQDLLMGTGYGLRLVFLGFPLRFDVAYSYNMKKFSSPKYYISLGLDF